MTVIEAEDITFSHGGQPVLRGISFTVDRGEFFILIGPNGSGKTTLMKLMAGVWEWGRPRGRVLFSRVGVPGGAARKIPRSPDGSLRIMGKSVAAYRGRELARRVAFVPQHPMTDIPFSVREVVLMGRSPRQGIFGLTDEADLDVTRRAMRFTDVAHLADRRLDRLSGGELQRVFIARALCQEPEILLLDEPTAFLDMAHQIQVMDILERLKTDDGVTVVMISHDINLAAMYGDRLLLMAAGTAAAVGSPAEVLTYEHLERAYGCRVVVDRNPMGNFPRVTPAPGRILWKKDGIMAEPARPS